MQDFSAFDFKPEITRALGEMGFVKPTPIQAEALPVLLAAETDYLGLAATGTGKTAAFGLPLLNKVDPTTKTLQAVVLCPTRELAVQTATQLTAIGRHLGIAVPAIYGGAGYGEQFRVLREAIVIVATPGRLVDHLDRGSVSLAGVKWLVLDEADRMISMGFREELERILKSTVREQCRTWLFSATMPKYLREVAERYVKTPQIAQVGGKVLLSGTVRQIYFNIRDWNKPKGLAKLIDAHDGFYGLVFCQTKGLVMDVTEFLRGLGHAVDCLHGDKHQRDRERTLSLFRDRKVTVLVCTDVAARGLDVQDLTHVINYSLPLDLDSYIHRIGRTGRNGKEGIAISLIGPEQLKVIPRIERRIGTKLEAATLPGRREIVAAKIERVLPRFAAAPNHERAIAALGEGWNAALEAMTKPEIAARFLALAHADLFVDVDESAESEGRGERPRFEARPRFDGARPFGRRPRFEEGGREQRRFDGPPRERRFGPRPERPARPAYSPEKARPGHFVKPAASETAPSAAPETAPGAILDVEAAEREFTAMQERPVRPAAKPFEKHVGKPFVRRFGKKPFGEKAYGKPFDESNGEKPFGKRAFGKPYGEKPFGKRPFGKPFGERPFGEKAFGKPFGERPFGEKAFGKPFGERPFGKKAFGKPFGEKPFGKRPFGKPFGDKPFGKKAFGKPYGGKPFGKKPFGKPFAKKPGGFTPGRGPSLPPPPDEATPGQ